MTSRVVPAAAALVLGGRPRFLCFGDMIHCINFLWLPLHNTKNSVKEVKENRNVLSPSQPAGSPHEVAVGSFRGP